MTTPTQVHPDTPQWFIPYMRENDRQHYDLGTQIAQMEARLLWRGLGGIAVIMSLAVTAVKLL